MPGKSEHRNQAKSFILLALFCSFTALASYAGDLAPKRIILKATQGLQRAELWVRESKGEVKGVLLLCPGVNENGKFLVEDPAWIKWATEQQMILVGASFASDVTGLQTGHGYYYVEQGTGQILLAALDDMVTRHLRSRGHWLYLMGFSGGAHFVDSFAQWKPEVVGAWCAYSAAWWGKPTFPSVPANKEDRNSDKSDFLKVPAVKFPPGMVVCGQEDIRYGPSLIHFYKGRASGLPWLWVSPARNNHSWDARVSVFTRNYFSVILNNEESTLEANKAKGVWVDTVNETLIQQPSEASRPIEAGWLPSKTLLEEWQAIHEP